LVRVADTFEIGRRSVARFVSLARSGEGLRPKPHGGGYPPSVDNRALTLLRERAENRPDAFALHKYSVVDA
jgi:hypothetical protein